MQAKRKRRSRKAKKQDASEEMTKVLPGSDCRLGTAEGEVSHMLPMPASLAKLRAVVRLVMNRRPCAEVEQLALGNL